MTEKPQQPCPYVDCGSSDAFSYNTDGYGKCHSCSRSYPSKDKMYDWAKQEYPLKEKQVQKTPSSVTYEGIRGLKPSVAKLYGIQRQLDDEGEWVRDAFKYPSNTKYRTPDKKFYTKDKGVKVFDLFGPDFNAGSSKRIYLTEGEYDSASLFQVLGETYPVKSLPTSSITGPFGDKLIKHNHKYLSSFEQIVYAGELSDEAGKNAADRLYQAYPDKFFFVPLTKWKDANEFLENGDENDLKWAALKPQRYSPDNFFCSDSAVENAIRKETPYAYVPTGHEGLDDKIRGLVRGGMTFIKAPQGTGKTELVRYFEMGLLKDPDTKIGLLHAEEMKSTTYRAMATYELGANVRTREDAQRNGFTEDQVIEAAKKAADNERTVVFEMRSSDDPMALLDYVRLAATAYGVSYVFVDHVQRLAYLSQSGVDGATATLTALGSRMAQMCKELDIGVVFISQVNTDGKTKYAVALEEEAIICISIERDVESEDETVNNTTNFKVTKNRPFAKLGPAGSVYYNPDTTLLTESNLDL